MTLAADLKNAVVLKQGIIPQVATSTVTASGVDLNDSNFNPFTATLSLGAASGTAATLDVKLQESDTSGGTYTDISGATFQQLGPTDDNTILSILVKNRTKRWVRMVATIAGTTPSFAIAGVIQAQKRIVGGSGVVT